MGYYLTTRFLTSRLLIKTKTKTFSDLSSLSSCQPLETSEAPGRPAMSRGRTVPNSFQQPPISVRLVTKQAEIQPPNEVNFVKVFIGTVGRRLHDLIGHRLTTLILTCIQTALEDRDKEQRKESSQQRLSSNIQNSDGCRSPNQICNVCAVRS